MTVLQIILFAAISYLALSGLYQMILALASYRKRSEVLSATDKKNKFLVLVPAYKCDDVILNSTQKNLGLKFLYQQSNFDIQVIADQLKSTTVESLKKMGANVHEVSFRKSTKVKALQSAIKANKGLNDAVVVLDADNVASINFLQQANKYINQGYQVIQGNRKAANKNSTFALLDGLSEKANTKMLCEGANQLGLSSKLSGSAMVFDYELFQEAILKMEAIGGFDKELELYFTQNRHFIKYAPELEVLDEKVSNHEAFAKQRGRWLQAQYNFLKHSFTPALKALGKGNFDYFHKTMQLALPPRALSPFALISFALLSVLMSFESGIWLSVLGLVLTMGSYLLVLKRSDFIGDLVKLIAAMPALFIAVIKSLKLMKKAKGEFLHTEHKVIVS